jgi:hypothetical protein
MLVGGCIIFSEEFLLSFRDELLITVPSFFKSER